MESGENAVATAGASLRGQEPPPARSVIRRSGVLLASRFVSTGVGAAVLVLIGRYLGPEQYGYYSFGLTLFQIGATICELGLNAVVSREAILDPAVERPLLRRAFSLRFAAGVVYAVLGVIATALVLSPDEFRYAAVFLAAIPLTAAAIYVNALSRRLFFYRVALLGVLQNLIWLLLVVALVLLKAPFFLFVVGFVVNIAVSGLLTWIISRGTLRGKNRNLTDSSSWGLLKDSVPLGVGGALVILYGKIDGILLFSFSGPVAAGQYAIAYRVLDQLSVLPMIIGSIFSPAFQLAVRGGSGVEVATRWMRMALVAAVLTCIPVALWSQTIVSLLFGRDYLEGGRLLGVLALVGGPIGMAYVLTGICIAFRLAKKQLIVAAVGLVINIPLNLLLIPVHGALGAAIATAVTEIAIVIGLWFAARGRLAANLVSARTVLFLLVCVIIAGALRLTSDSILCFVMAVMAMTSVIIISKTFRPSDLAVRVDA